MPQTAAEASGRAWCLGDKLNPVLEDPGTGVTESDLERLRDRVDGPRHWLSTADGSVPRQANPTTNATGSSRAGDCGNNGAPGDAD